MHIVVRVTVLIALLAVGFVGIYFGIYYAWLSATPNPGMEYYGSLATWIFAGSLAAIGLGIALFFLLRKRKPVPRPPGG